MHDLLSLLRRCSPPQYGPHQHNPILSCIPIRNRLRFPFRYTRLNERQRLSRRMVLDPPNVLGFSPRVKGVGQWIGRSDNDVV